ncbi:Polyketide cyclase / dehydrase and lipid transport [Streptomyces sp. YIM 130001]|uniref:SRPBCC family protein n=1 Tax=Streptomyces sp. YIM 130001 TaxID=2259644 RepID=UPI000ED9D490|nr:SRPBCC family protein [Streptomyces sp. YIM 130001]RII20952.1 Polyketide cyclase / dehydrase and lipid transport [Streptomyces sp. YIM 130001]
MAIQRKHTMYHSTVIDADPDTVWAVVRDALKVVSIVSGEGAKKVGWAEGGAPEKVPARYDFTLAFNDGLVQQEVAGRNEVDRAQTYRAVAPATGVDAYLATIQVRPITNDPSRCFFDWSRELTIAEDADTEVVETIIAIMAKQTDLMRDHFAQK